MDQLTGRRIPWEYTFAPMGNPLQAGSEESANALGKQGWELVTIEGGTWIFKRPHVDLPEGSLQELIEETVPLVELEQPVRAIGGSIAAAAPAPVEA